MIDGKIESADLDNAERRITKLLDESIVADDEFKNRKNIAANEQAPYRIKAWRQIDLNQLNMDKLREEFKKAEYKNIEIADLRAFINDKMQQLMQRNVTRIPFAQRLQEIIDRYNAGGAATEDYFNDLMTFMEGLKAEEERHIREGLTETKLELFDLLKKENLTKAEEQEVKLATKKLLKRLMEEKPTVLVNDWFKGTQTKLQVDKVIDNILEQYLPESYHRIVFKENGIRCFSILFAGGAGWKQECREGVTTQLTFRPFIRSSLIYHFYLLQ